VLQDESVLITCDAYHIYTVSADKAIMACIYEVYDFEFVSLPHFLAFLFII
jgi:hypothetical protein